MNDSVSLYNYTVQTSQTITHAIFGHFSAPKAQEIVIARGKVLELLRPDGETGRMNVVLSTEAFGIIRGIKPFRLPGATRDHLVVGSDSGKFVVLEYIASLNLFQPVHQETFGKTGCRRIVPGQYLAVDPNGRAAMIGAIEKQKFVYSLSRDLQNNMTISSPLEAHKSNTIVYSMCGVHVVEFDNPIFACIEASYDENTNLTPNDKGEYTVQKNLVYYEMDLGLNTVSRVWTESVDPTASMVLAVPAEQGRPGGVLVCAEDAIYYHNRDMPTLRVPLPRRYTGNEQGTMIACGTCYSIIKKKVNMFFFLLQTERGDIFKVDFTCQQDTVNERVNVTDITVAYFDTLPVGVALCILDTGYLFVASESGDSPLLKLLSFGGDLESTPHTTYSQHHDVGLRKADATDMGEEEQQDIVYFVPGRLTNLSLISYFSCHNPIMDLHVSDITQEGLPQIYTLEGRAHRSQLTVSRQGLAVNDIVETELPGKPSGLFTLKTHVNSDEHRYVVLPFVDGSIVLEITDNLVEVDNTGLLTDVKTIGLASVVTDPAYIATATADQTAYVQVYAEGMRIVFLSSDSQPGMPPRTFDWRAPATMPIECCAFSKSQIIIGLRGGELKVFEFEMGSLVEVSSYTIGIEVSAVALTPVVEGRLRGEYALVAGLDSTVRVFSLQVGQPLQQVVVQVLPATCHQLSVSPLHAHYMHVFIGLTNGVLIRSLFDLSNGYITDPRKRVVGTRPVSLSQAALGDSNTTAIIATSTRAWCHYTSAGKIMDAPLALPHIDYVASFTTAQLRDSLVYTRDNRLCIVQCEDLNSVFAQKHIPLRYTGRKINVFNASEYTFNLAVKQSQHSATPIAPTYNITFAKFNKNMIFVTETDDNTYPHEIKEQINTLIKQAVSGQAETENSEKTEEELAEEAETQLQIEMNAGYPPANQGQWGSCIRMVDPVSLETTDILELTDNEAIVSSCVCVMKGMPYLVVGTVKALVQLPRRSHSGGFIRVYAIKEQEQQVEETVTDAVTGITSTKTATKSTISLSFVHATAVTDVPLALSPFPAEQLLAVGVGNALRFYELGLRKMLLKCENKLFKSPITRIHSVDATSLFVCDANQGMFAVAYSKTLLQTNAMGQSIAAAAAPSVPGTTATTFSRKLEIVAHPYVPRHVYSSCLVDSSSLILGDRFGNLAFSRLGASAIERIALNPAGLVRVSSAGQVIRQDTVLLSDMANFHVGEMVTAMSKCVLSPGGSEVVVYSTIMGSIGIILPLTAQEDVDFFTTLELHMRSNVPSIVGRDHMSFRSYYHPVCNTIDGDLCHIYVQAYGGGSAAGVLSKEQLVDIAEGVVCEPKTVVRKLEEVRQRVM